MASGSMYCDAMKSSPFNLPAPILSWASIQVALLDGVPTKATEWIAMVCTQGDKEVWIAMACTQGDKEVWMAMVCTQKHIGSIPRGFLGVWSRCVV